MKKKEYNKPAARVKVMRPMAILQGSPETIKYDDEITIDDDDNVEVL